ncbi:MAG: hypothetical protein HQ485_07705 [Acidobacteria bacterium]|jgi:hypothetical protein|nr:hypothetical protein [Acidobacteriota bacterium]
MARPDIRADVGATTTERDLNQLFHRLNNQLGIILANAELLEHRLAEETHRARATQVVAGALEAIRTSQQIRQIIPIPETS